MGCPHGYEQELPTFPDIYCLLWFWKPFFSAGFLCNRYRIKYPKWLFLFWTGTTKEQLSFFFNYPEFSIPSPCHKHKRLCRSHLSLPFIDIYQHLRKLKKKQKSSRDLDIVKVKMYPAGNFFSMLLKNQTKWRKGMQRSGYC